MAPGKSPIFGGPEPQPAVRLKLPWVLALPAMGVAYMWFYTMVPRNFRFPLLAGLILVAFVLLGRMHRVRNVLFLSPFILGFGNADFSLPPFQPTLATLFCLGLTALWILEKLIWNEPFRIPWKMGLGLVVVSAAVQIVSIAISIQVVGQHFWNAVREGWSLFLFLPMALITVDQIRTERDALALARSMVAGLLVLGAIGVIQYFGISGFSRIDVVIGYLYKGRIEATFPGANVFAGYLELSTPLALGLTLHEKRFAWKAIALSAFILGFLSTLYTFSRGGFLMTVFGSVCVLVVKFRSKPLLPASFIALVIWVMISNSGTFARQLSLVTSPGDVISQPTLVHRYITYKSFWYTFLEHPWRGVGWGALGFFTGRTQIYTFWDIRHTLSTENIAYFGGGNSLFLNQAVKGGIISLASLVILCLAVFKSIVDSMKRSEGMPEAAIACGIVAFAGHQLVDHLLRWPQINAFFWLSTGAMIALSILRGRSGGNAASRVGTAASDDGDDSEILQGGNRNGEG